MAATLIQEDGSKPSGANTYLTLAEYETYIDERGLTDATSDDAKTGRIIQSMDYLESKNPRYQGKKATREQSLVWPRYGVYVKGYSVNTDVIPQNLKDAQAQLVYDSASSAIYQVGDGKEVVRKKIDVIEKQYAETGDTNPQNTFTKVEALLKPLYKQGGAFGVVLRV